MLILLIAYLGGVLTILSPCILPVLPFVFARADRPFRSHGLPMLLGMALAFAAVATLAAVGGGWIVTLNEYGRYAAIAMLALFGVTLLFPRVADRMTRPLVALGMRMSEPQGNATSSAVFSPLLLGVGTGLLWAPCAGPILGLILTGAALNGASVGTSLLLLAYAAGACTSLAAALLFGGRVFSVMKRSLHGGEWVRRAAGTAVLVGVGAIALGLDTGLLARLSVGTTSALEQALVDKIKPGKPHGEPIAAQEDAGFVRVSDNRPAAVPARELRVEGNFPSLAGATEWINSPPLTPEALRGKVVLVDFWTYSCINCLRTLPYLNAWAEKYKDAGLVVLGVHTPEFAFEKRSANVRRATKDLGIGFPVATDNDFAIWRAFGNRAWPAFYFVDAEGRVRYHQFGEGRYDKAEQVIQQLLAEAGQARVPAGLVAPSGQGTQAQPGPAARLVRRNLPGPRARARFCLARRCGARSCKGLPGSFFAAHQSVGAGRRLDRGGRARGAQQCERPHRLSLSGARPAPGARPHGQRQAGALQGAGGWQAAAGGSWRRHRRAGLWGCRCAEALSAGAPSHQWD